MLTFAVARPGYTQHRLGFGGVAFEVEADEAVRWQLWPEFQRHTFDPDQFPLAARVQCCVTLDPTLRRGATRTLATNRPGPSASSSACKSGDTTTVVSVASARRSTVKPRAEIDAVPGKLGSTLT